MKSTVSHVVESANSLAILSSIENTCHLGKNCLAVGTVHIIDPWVSIHTFVEYWIHMMYHMYAVHSSDTRANLFSIEILWGMIWARIAWASELFISSILEYQVTRNCCIIIVHFQNLKVYFQNLKVFFQILNYAFFLKVFFQIWKYTFRFESNETQLVWVQCTTQSSANSGPCWCPLRARTRLLVGLHLFETCPVMNGTHIWVLDIHSGLPSIPSGTESLMVKTGGVLHFTPWQCCQSGILGQMWETCVKWWGALQEIIMELGRAAIFN
jgi:hypothetical protein